MCDKDHIVAAKIEESVVEDCEFLKEIPMRYRNPIRFGSYLRLLKNYVRLDILLPRTHC